MVPDVSSWDTIQISQWKSDMKGVSPDAESAAGVPLLLEAMRRGRFDLGKRLLEMGASIHARDGEGKGIAEALFRCPEVKSPKVLKTLTEDQDWIFDKIEETDFLLFFERDRKGLPPMVSAFMVGNWATPVMEMGSWVKYLYQRSSPEDWMFDGMEDAKNSLGAVWLRGFFSVFNDASFALDFMRRAEVSPAHVPAGESEPLMTVLFYQDVTGWDNVSIPENADPLALKGEDGSLLLANREGYLPYELVEKIWKDPRFVFAREPGAPKWAFSECLPVSERNAILDEVVYAIENGEFSLKNAPFGSWASIGYDFKGKPNRDDFRLFANLLKMGLSAPSYCSQDFAQYQSPDKFDGFDAVLDTANEVWSLSRPEFLEIPTRKSRLGM